MAAAEYVTLKMARSLMDHVDQVLAAGTLGYRSRAEFVADAVRRHLEHTRVTGRVPGDRELHLPD